MIVVVGAKGMLGHDLMEVLEGDVRGLDLPELDITDLASVRKSLLTLRPRLIVNAAAYTDVDGCEANVEQAMAVNGEGVGLLALTAREIGAKLVQVSTDYVFDGNKGEPYLEDDAIGPLSIYGESKLAGELNAAMAPEFLIVRTQWLYGLHGKNFVETMLRLAAERSELSVVDDQVGSPTFTRDLALAIKALLDKGCCGTYHVANAGFCSWNEFARAIFVEEGVAVTVSHMSTEQLNRPARRPLYSTLDCGKLAADAGFVPRPWREALKEYLEIRKK